MKGPTTGKPKAAPPVFGTPGDSKNKREGNQSELLTSDMKHYYFLTPPDIEPVDPAHAQDPSAAELKQPDNIWQRFKQEIFGTQNNRNSDYYTEIHGSQVTLSSSDSQNVRLAPSEEKLSFMQKSYLALAVIATIFFNIPLGLVAIACSIKASRAYSEGDTVRAKRYANVSLVLSLLCMVVTVTIVIAVVSYVSLYSDEGK